MNDELTSVATCNIHQIVGLLERHVARVVSNPTKTRAIAEAKVKTDNVDAQVLAQLPAAGCLPSVWLLGSDTAFRRQVACPRAHRQPVRRAQDRIHPILRRKPHSPLHGRGSVRAQGPGLAGRAGAAAP
jgi:transposase